MKPNEKVIFETPDKTYRIVEIEDFFYEMDNLKGDCFNFEVSGFTGTREELAEQERAFEALVNDNGVFGYALERWNPAPGEGYEHVDSCFGFVGSYDASVESFNHYIIDELKNQITTKVDADETHN